MITESINVMVTRVVAAGLVPMVSAVLGAAIAAADPAPKDPKPVPGNVWVSPGEIPMNGVYHWAPASPTATGKASFLSTRLCGNPAADLLPPASAISTQTATDTAASVVQAAGQWPDESPVASDKAAAFQSGIRAQLNQCQGINQVQRLELRPAPSWFGFAATLSVGNGDHPSSEVHIYNVVPPGSGAISELAVTVPLTAGQPSPWVPVDDVTVLRAVARPLCKGAC
jgi:hypothetical protein